MASSIGSVGKGEANLARCPAAALTPVKVCVAPDRTATGPPMALDVRQGRSAAGIARWRINNCIADPS
jgi:hypothetical protein